MKKLIQFFFEPVDDDPDSAVSVFAEMDMPDHIEDYNNRIYEIQSKIDFYLEAVPSWYPEQLVFDVIRFF